MLDHQREREREREREWPLYWMSATNSLQFQFALLVCACHLSTGTDARSSLLLDYEDITNESWLYETAARGYVITHVRPTCTVRPHKSPTSPPISHVRAFLEIDTNDEKLVGEIYGAMDSIRGRGGDERFYFSLKLPLARRINATIDRLPIRSRRSVIDYLSLVSNMYILLLSSCTKLILRGNFLCRFSVVSIFIIIMMCYW